MSVQLVTRRFTVDDYHRMAKAGILTEDDRVELIEGQIVEMAPIGRRHASRVDRLNRLLQRLVGDKAIVRVQGPVRLDPYSEPQPDLALLRPRDDFYEAAHPGPADILLLVEVADSSVVYDRGTKLLIYARAGIPEVWLEDLTRNGIEVYRSPSPQGYQQTHRVGRGQRIAPQAFPDLDLAVDDILS
jgi:Uma2 family endonuclease